MRDYFLRCDTRKSLDAKLKAAGVLAESMDGEIYSTVHLDYIGTIYEPTDAVLTDDEGFEYPEQQKVEGYHANIRGVLTPEQEDLLPIIPTPNNPVRVFA